MVESFRLVEPRSEAEAEAGVIFSVIDDPIRSDPIKLGPNRLGQSLRKRGGLHSPSANLPRYLLVSLFLLKLHMSKTSPSPGFAPDS